MDSGTGSVFVWFSISSLTKLLFIKTFSLIQNLLRDLCKDIDYYPEKLEKIAKKTRSKALWGELFLSYSFLIYMTICKAIMLNFQAHIYFRKNKALKERYTVKFV